MALREETREINAKSAFCRQMPATKAMIKLGTLMSLGGEHLYSFIEGEADLPSFIRLTQNSDPDELMAIVKEFVCTVRVDGEEISPAMFDMKFSGDLWEIVQMFAFACEVNYKDFFEQGLASMTDHQSQ